MASSTASVIQVKRREEIREQPDRIVGIVSEIPECENGELEKLKLMAEFG